jgi:hypothetical protein
MDADGEICNLQNSAPQMPPKNALSIGCLFSQQTSAIHKKLSCSSAQFPERLINHPSPRERGEAGETLARFFFLPVAP